MAHTGVRNDAVPARMEPVKAMAAATDGLGRIAKGETAVDAGTARRRRADRNRAARIPEPFTAPVDDPLSEAKPAIWETRDDFADGAATPETLADDLSRGLESPAALRAGLA
jgi:cytochrome c556